MIFQQKKFSAKLFKTKHKKLQKKIDASLMKMSFDAFNKYIQAESGIIKIILIYIIPDSEWVTTPKGVPGIVTRV